MGYTTNFNGEFTCTPALTPDQIAYLQRFSSSRRMKRNVKIVSKFADPLREAVGLPVGVEGEFYVGSEDTDAETIKSNDPRYLSDEELLKLRGWTGPGPVTLGQRYDSSVLNYNEPPSTQPGTWCQWTVSGNGEFIQWDEGEKFYNYVAWLEYIIDNFLSPWGISLNGQVSWQGEKRNNQGTIYVKNNKVEALQDKIVSQKPSWQSNS